MPIPRRDFIKTAASAVAAMGLAPAFASEKPAGHATPPAGGGMPGSPVDLPPVETEAGAVRFLVLGDWGWAGVKSKGSKDPYVLSLAQVADSKGMADLAEERRPQFIVSVGDNFYPNGVTSADDPRWAQSFEKVYNQPALQVPWYVALGNHDYRGSVPAQIEYTKRSKRWRMPARYFSVTEKSSSGLTVQLLFLDTCPFVPGYAGGGHSDVATQDKSAQLAWLERELAASKADWKIVVGHHPLWTYGVRRDVPTETSASWLAPILRKHGVKAYFCGHEHDAQHIEIDGLHCFIHGNGSEARPTGAGPGTRYAESRIGFGYATADASTLTIRFVDALGEIRHTANIRR